ncbi:bis-aminopropyl spermidine synthase family protein [Bradyrhizobium sp.]|uniref:bis-aminopropyl spermidine synthase family protein n=1 Tax=Bradyrhizobium sp. TaxID=376 RepID=UPI0025B9E619|nr:bis-aminopropyl spermidine synthase family protein [Bradyrhizobium sp.]
MKDTILQDVAEATSLREGVAGVEALLRAVHRNESGRLADAAREARLPIPIATAIRRELEKRGILMRQHGLAFTEEGEQWVREALGFAEESLSVEVPLTPQAQLPPALEQVVRAMEAHLAAAPQTDVTLDQAPCTAETSVRRAALLYRSGALEGRRIALLGDDDSVALSIGLFGRLLAGRQLPRRLVVFEIDERRVAFLQRAAREADLAVEIIAHDLREPLPAQLLGTFDSFETDPPYTIAGASLFVRRGVELLEHGRGYGMLSFGHTSPPDRLKLQAALTSIGVATTALYPAFNRYAGASILGSTSELHELVATGTAVANAQWHGPLYTAEVNPRVRLYQCTECRQRWELGNDDIPATIEELKDKGCPACGNHDFRRTSKRTTR